MSSAVGEFYKDKTVLLTGGTGFLGKMLTEKLLRTCAVSRIYLLVRPKKGLLPEERLHNLFEEPVFQKLREKEPNSMKKVLTIEGDLAQKHVGLKDEDIERIKNNVNIVFHCGASLNMDSKLGDAVITNVRGTSEILEIMKEARNLHAFVLVSTAYSNCYEKCIEEKFYEAPIDPELLIKITEELKPNILNSISPGLVGIWPNSYVYSKAVAENLLLTKGNKLPVALFRPAIVTSTASEPVPGWSDNLYGPLGILLSSHCGILRVVRANGNIKSNTVPGDMCINALLCLAWDVSNKWKSSTTFLPPVLNFSGRNSKLFMPIKNYVDFSRIDFPPFKRAMWHQMLFLIEMEYAYLMAKFFLHTIPAYLIDSLLVLSCRKPRMKKIYAKLEKTTDVLCYFLLNEWDIVNENVLNLWKKLNSTDRTTFNFDIDTIDVDTYFQNFMIGLKKYILKEDMMRAKFHKQRYKRLTLLHYTLKYALLGLATYPLYRGLSRLIFRKKT